MKDIFLSTLTGFGCGVVFAAFKLPVPAPPVFAGVAGIIGLWIGFTILRRLQQRRSNSLEGDMSSWPIPLFL
jgi:XapX domain-containing protein